MVTPVNKNTFLSEYNDDFRDSDHYHRILFNSGRALQARELTQSQTIIQAEVARIGRYLFDEGGMFNVAADVSSARQPVPYVVVQSLPTGYALLKGCVIEGPDLGGDKVSAIIKAVVPSTESSDGRNYLMIAYQSGGSSSSEETSYESLRFGQNQTLSYEGNNITGTLLTQATSTIGNPVTGYGSMAETPAFNSFVAGHVITVEAQSIVIADREPNPTATIGFYLTEEIITAADEVSLYDNSGATPNLTSPGADRLKITLTLSTEVNVPSGKTFYPIIELAGGEVVNEKQFDQIAGDLGRRVSNSLKDVTGDYVVRGTGGFALSVEADSDDDYLLYKVDEGIGYVNGNRIEKQIEKYRVLKPRDIATDTETVVNESYVAKYGNYFLTDSNTVGLIGEIADYGQINLNDAVNLGGSNLGTARVRSIDKVGNDYRVHVFDVDIGSNNIGSIRSIGTNSTNVGNLVAIDDRYDLYDRNNNYLLFPLSYDRVHDLSGLTITTGVVLTATASGNQASFSTSNPDYDFDDTEQWILQQDATGELISPVTIASGGAGSNSVTISGLTDGAVTLYAFERKTAVEKKKTLQEGTEEAGLSLTNGAFTLANADIYKFNSIIDDTTSVDITNSFILDNGQRDNYYAVGSGKLRSGATVPSGTITVNYDYFAHQAGDYFGPTSYVNFGDNYAGIPRYKTSTGNVFKLSDVIDMRPRKNASGTFSGGIANIENLPRNGTLFDANQTRYWKARIDGVSIAPDGRILISKGRTGIDPEPPNNVPLENMKLAAVYLNPYTVSENDVIYEQAQNDGFKMEDIRKLATRVTNLETVTSLTLTELKNTGITINDPNDASLPNREQLGLTGDAFDNDLQSDILDPDYRAQLVPTGLLMPITFTRTIGFEFDSAESEYVVRKGNTIWPKYEEEVMVSNTVASKAISISEYTATVTRGTGVIQPNGDTWTVRTEVDPGKQDTSVSKVGKAKTITTKPPKGRSSIFKYFVGGGGKR